MFRITEVPSSGSLVQCLAKNYKNDSIVSVDMDKPSPVQGSLIKKKYIYSNLKCIVFDKLLKPRQSFRITLYNTV